VQTEAVRLHRLSDCPFPKKLLANQEMFLSFSGLELECFLRFVAELELNHQGSIRCSPAGFRRVLAMENTESKDRSCSSLGERNLYRAGCAMVAAGRQTCNGPG